MPLLEVRNLSFTYPDGQPALDGVELRVERGETVGVIGPNGAGKSTLLLHLNGVLPGRSASARIATGADAGVWIDGVMVERASLAHARRAVGLMFQNPDDQLFCATTLEDVAFGPLNFGRSSAEARRLALEALEAVGMAGAADRPPHHLSMGERKRVCLAGIIACEPEILALDEPTGNLDPRGRRRLIELLRSLGRTMVIATHDLEMTLEMCDRVLVLDAGIVRAEGPTREILSQEDLLARHGLETPLSLKLEHDPSA